jgi:poly-gamma-glutamate synthesis protein (capsule biosynthesis protein)
VFSLANNHAADHGKQGFERTREACAELGVEVAGLRGPDGLPVLVWQRPGWRLGVVAWTHWLNRRAWPGCRLAGSRDVETAAWMEVRSHLALDTLVGLPHWDYEFHHVPRPATRALALRLLDAGFDVLAGCHPHVVQPLEHVGPGLCAYSLGSLNGPSMPVGSWPTRLGVALEVHLSRAAGLPPVSAYMVHPFMQAGEGRRIVLRPIAGAGARAHDRFVRRLHDLVPPATAAPTARP